MINNPVDLHLGVRQRRRRLFAAMSQAYLAEALAAPLAEFQSVEAGLKRIGAERLQGLANLLEVQPSYFFQGALWGSDGKPTTTLAGPLMSFYRRCRCRTAWTSFLPSRAFNAFSFVGKL